MDPYEWLDFNDDDEGHKRAFDPQLSPAHRRLAADQLIIYNPAKSVQHLQQIISGRLGVDAYSVVVSIDGACRGNGTRSARAAWGVYFGPQSRHNSCGMLDSSLAQTSTRAEIEALSKALDIIHNLVSRDFSLQHYYIRTDSSYLAKTFSGWIQTWISNGGKKFKGKRPAHFGALRKIHERLDDMTYGDDGGIQFKFWHVPREENKEADALANQAFDKESGAGKMAGTAKPRVLAISLAKRAFYEELQGSLVAKIKASSVYQCVEDDQSAKRMLLQDPPPNAVLITDEAVTLKEHAHVWDAVLKYIRQGGTAVLMGIFSGFVNPRSLKDFFATAGLEWEAASYHRTTLKLNAQSVGVNAASKLLPEYSQKAVFLKNAKAFEAWYVTDDDSVTESLVFPGRAVHTVGESPILLASVGQGKLGYVGDVNNEAGTEAVVMAMCGL
ncbi:ribonuclease H-like protein [Trichoderma sp. SZMC 28014]